MSQNEDFPSARTLLIATIALVLAVIAYLIAMSEPPSSSKQRQITSTVHILSQHHHPQPTTTDNGPLNAEVGDMAEISLAPQERIIRPVAELRLYCETRHDNSIRTYERHVPSAGKTTNVLLQHEGYCHIVLIESLLPVPPGTGQFDGDMLKLRQLPSQFNCKFNPLFAQVLVSL